MGPSKTQVLPATPGSVEVGPSDWKQLDHASSRGRSRRMTPHYKEIDKNRKIHGPYIERTRNKHFIGNVIGKCFYLLKSFIAIKLNLEKHKHFS